MNAKTVAVRESEIERRWYVVDATDQTLGRLASRIARVLEGKHKPTYQPNLDSGDHVIVLNAARIAVTSALHRDGAHAFYERLGWERTGVRLGKKLG